MMDFLSDESDGAGEHGSCNLLDAVQRELGVDSAGLRTYLRKDAVQLGYDEKLHPGTLDALRTKLRARRGEEMAAKMWELGLVQLLSVQDPATLGEIVSLSPYAESGMLPDELEQDALRTLLPPTW